MNLGGFRGWYVNQKSFMNASFSVVCYKSKTLSNGENPLMLQVTKGGKSKYQSLGISINPKFWDFTRNKPKLNCPNKEFIQKIILGKQAKLQQRMLELNSELKEYTTTTLLCDESKKFELKTVSDFYQELIEKFLPDFEKDETLSMPVYCKSEASAKNVAYRQSD